MTVGVLVWVFTVASLAGVAVTVINSYDTTQDIRALNSRGIGNGRRTIAWANFRTQAFRAVELALFTTIGLLALFDLPVGVRRPVGYVALVVIDLLIVGNSVSDRVVKKRLLSRHSLDAEP